MGGESGVPSESADCVRGSTIHLTTDTNSSVSKDERSAIATQQEDNGRSGESSNKINMGCSTDHVKGNTMINACGRCSIWSIQYVA